MENTEELERTVSYSRTECTYFVKNEDYKFIVGFVLFNINENLGDRVFNKGYVYAGGMGYIDASENLVNEDAGESEENNNSNE